MSENELGLDLQPLQLSRTKEGDLDTTRGVSTRSHISTDANDHSNFVIARPPIFKRRQANRAWN